MKTTRLIALSIALALAGCSGEEPAEPTATPAAVAQETPATPSALAGQLAEAGAISTAEGRIKQQQARFLELAKEYEATTGDSLQGLSLNEEQAAYLETLLADEEDISVKGLITSLLDTRKEMQSLEDRIAELKEKLPTPDVVERGDSHLSMATDYLTNTHGFTKEEAEALAKRSLLTDNIAPGMEVWHFYADGVYGTTVTQGTAKVSPYFLNVRKYRKLNRERDDAVAHAESLAAEITVLEATRDQLRTELNVLGEEHMRVTAERDDLADQRDELVTEDQSLFYYVGSARDLKQQDILRFGGQRLKEWRKDLFDRSLDLRDETSITVHARDHAVRRINRVSLLPDKWKEGEDYRVTLNKEHTSATVHLERPSRFKNEDLIVVLK